MAVAFLIVPATAFATFVALYPHLWTDPIDHSKRMFDFREDSFSLQGAAFPNARVVDFPDGLRRIGVQLSDRFSLGQYIANLMHSEFNLPLSHWARELDLTLAIAGSLLLAAWLTAGRWPIERTLPLVVLVGQTVLIAATYQLDYSRYLLPAVPLLAMASPHPLLSRFSTCCGCHAGATNWDKVRAWHPTREVCPGSTDLSPDQSPRSDGVLVVPRQQEPRTRLHSVGRSVYR